MDFTQTRTWAEVSLGNIRHNYLAMRARFGSGTRFLGVVKADAYGHGAVEVSKLLGTLGCECLAVACIEEAVALREAGIRTPVLIMGYTDPACTPALIEYDIIQAIFSGEAAGEMSAAAAAAGKTLKAHIKIDTGMGRLGFPERGKGDSVREILPVLKLPGLDFEGVFTHFPVADVKGDGFTRAQYDDFCRIVDEIQRISGVKFKIKHCANSGAVLNYKWAYLDMVRPGLALYGVYPEAGEYDIPLRPAMELKTRIAQVKNLKPGDTVSYGRMFTADRDMRIAVVTIGYADGLHRALSGNMDMLTRGRRVRQIGTVCMDMCMIDVSDVKDAAEGDVVTVFGCDGGESIPVEELAVRAGTISWELLCAVSPRVPRIYKG